MPLISKAGFKISSVKKQFWNKIKISNTLLKTMKNPIMEHLQKIIHLNSSAQPNSIKKIKS